MKHPKRAYNAPVWVMGVIAVLEAISVWSSLAVDTINSGATLSPVLFFTTLLWPVFFIAQTFLYWVIRKRKYPRLLAWIHLTCCIMSFLIPVVFALFFLGGVRTRMIVYYYDVVVYVPKGLMIIGNVFFILTIINAFSANSAPPIEDEN